MRTLYRRKCTEPTIGIWKTNAAESAKSWNRYNRQRLHSALRYLTPEEFEHAIEARKRHGADVSSGKPNRFTTTLTGAASTYEVAVPVVSSLNYPVTPPCRSSSVCSGSRKPPRYCLQTRLRRYCLRPMPEC